MLQHMYNLRKWKCIFHNNKPYVNLGMFYMPACSLLGKEGGVEEELFKSAHSGQEKE